ncbi:MAG: hypothetical protein JWP87_2530 [Labilithrix sp.]|jgi:hypothetical protein|nr:hypothetical protein [Labilithrix sp.]
MDDVEPETREPETREPETRTKKKRKLPGEVSSRFRIVWITIAALYLATVWLDGVGSNWPAKIAPRPWIYFSQVAALFVNAAPKVIDYRAEGWSCSEHRWTEIDVRPYFHIDADNKENRFQRALQFYRKNRAVMRALEDFIVKRHNATGANIGGVRFSSLRLPYPPPGAHVAPFEQKPLASYSADQKHDWYWTPGSRRAQRCGRPEGPSEPRDDDAPKDDGNSRETDP